jgi:hypothetical protein
MYLGDQVQVFSTSLREIEERFLLQEFNLCPIEALGPSRKEELEKLEQAGFEQLFESLIVIVHAMFHYVEKSTRVVFCRNQ